MFEFVEIRAESLTSSGSFFAIKLLRGGFGVRVHARKCGNVEMWLEIRDFIVKFRDLLLSLSLVSSDFIAFSLPSN